MFKTKKINRISKQSALLLCVMYHIGMAEAESLKTDIPANINIQSQPLGTALKQFATQTGKNIIFDKTLVNGKTAPPVKGNYGEMDALQRVLENSGLEAVQEDGTIVIRTARPAVQKKAENLELDKVEVRAKRFYEVGPLPGLGLTKEQIPGNVQSISAKEIKEAHSLSITDLMNRKLQSVTVNDYQGNPFQMDVQYRGFTAGPQIGTPQGLSVFLDGVRVNEPFGDVVNWDMIPLNALAGMDVFPGSNPIFGLNTLGGAFTMKTKDGFNNTGVDGDVLTGSFGRKQLQVEGGSNNGTVGLFAAGNFFLEDGWRENSPSKVNQTFGKASYRGDKLDLNLSTLVVWNDLVGNGLIPNEMYKQDRNGIYTSPDTTENRLWQGQLSGSYFVSDNFTITGQAYRRKSKRHQIGADVFTDYDPALTAKRRANSTDQFTCLFKSSPNNKYGLPDYFVIPVTNDPSGIFSSGFVTDVFNNISGDPSIPIVNLETKYAANINQELPEDFLASYKYRYAEFQNFRERNAFNRGNKPPPNLGDVNPDYFNEPSFSSPFTDSGLGSFPSNTGGVILDFNNYFYTKDSGGNIIKNYVMILPVLNEQACADTQAAGFDIVKNGVTQHVDGAGFGQTGQVEGTPTSVFNDNQINQITNGASVQFNWNYEKHKFMVGGSIDSSKADYTNTQQLGFLDANRKAYLAPDLAHPQFVGAYQPLTNNEFAGTSITKSLYFSETWSPVETLHFSTSARYNQTSVKNTIAARSGLFAYGIGDLIGDPDNYNVCTDVDGNGVVNASDCAAVPKNFRALRLDKVLDPKETEKFNYYSLNPSFGASWQVTPQLNFYGNWAKGTRTPSVVELGCAFDKTPTFTGGNPSDPANYLPKSLAENRQCTLPTTLSGDPYLPQIKATTYDVGMRGKIGENMKWNLGAFQTDLQNDIYFVSVGNAQGFFDTIGKTRRRGIEAGISGQKDNLSFGINYSLTDATFQDNFLMISQDNSSAYNLPGYGQVINVKPGNRIPGVSLHNINANINYNITPKWRVGLSSVMHSDSFLRGNENNDHQKGVARVRDIFVDGVGYVSSPLPPTNNPGKVSGYATFNFQTSYIFNSEWTATLLVTNLFDKEYFSAGRLGRNPFSPSIQGAVGPDGYNHNSADWLSTNFIAPGAPRGVWFSLNWHFVPD
jgi:outer membrane receptor for Fe3+-dicitrate